jgi:hypothetical protein
MVRKLRVVSAAMAAALFLVVFSLFAVTRPAFGATRYIAQSAGTFSGGSACNGQTTITPATFNGITNAPGDVNYICGAISAPGGTSGLLVVKGSGSAGSPVTIKFDAGAVISAPYWGT